MAHGRGWPKAGYLPVYDEKIWYNCGLQAGEFNNGARLVILLKSS